MSERAVAGVTAAFVVLALSGLTACGRQTHQGSSQVVVRVNDKEITVSQLNETLQAMAGQVTPETTREAINTLIDEELLVQDAMKINLDRDPAAVQAFEHARRQILAQVYAQRMLLPKTPITLAEEEEYYRANPGLFENRRLYHLTVFTLPAADMSDVLRRDLDGAHSTDGVRDLLERHEIKFETQQLNSAAEELPMDKLPEFAKAGKGDLLEAQQKNGTLLLISVADVEAKPLSFERAKPMIERYLDNARNRRAIEDHLKQDKTVTKISYVGNFANLGTSPAAANAPLTPPLARTDGRPNSGQ